VDLASYEGVLEWSTQYAADRTEACRELSGGWRAVAYRLLSCAEHSQAFTRSIESAGDSPPFPERYVQERELFGFFVNGLAAIESLCYALYAIGSLLRPELFARPPRAINLKSTLTALRGAFPENTIGAILEGVAEDARYREWKTLRDILAHRVAPTREFFVHIGREAQPPAQWRVSHDARLLLDGDTTSSRLHWLTTTLNGLLKATAELVAAPPGAAQVIGTAT